MNNNTSLEDFVTIGKSCEDWLHKVKNCRKPSTFEKYQKIISKYFLPLMSEKEISELKSFTLKEIIEKGWDGKQAPSHSTIQSIRCVFMQMSRYSCIKLSPDSLEYVSKRDYVYTKQLSVFSLKSQRKLINFLIKEKDNFSMAIFICLYTGMRIGEICALRTQDISLSEKKISVRRTVQRLSAFDGKQKHKTRLVETSPKTPSSIREIPLCDYLFELLEKNMPETIYFLGNNYPADPRSVQYRFKVYQEKIGVNVMNFHSLRHTFATNCIAGGMDPKTLSVILGHADVKTTLNKYVHPSMDLKLQQINKCVKYFPVS